MPNHSTVNAKDWNVTMSFIGSGKSTIRNIYYIKLIAIYITHINFTYMNLFLAFSHIWLRPGYSRGNMREGIGQGLS